VPPRLEFARVGPANGGHCCIVTTTSTAEVPSSPAPAPSMSKRPERQRRNIGVYLRRHALFALVLVVGAILRLLCWRAYAPALLFWHDSFEYLADGRSLRPGVIRTLGYPVFLHGLSLVGSLRLVTAVQHLLGLGLGVLIYVLLVRRGAARWVGALAAAPVLLDGYQLDIEQFILSETLFSVLLLGAFAVLFWLRPVLLCRHAAGVGGLLAAASLVRVVALPLLVLVAGHLLVRRIGVRAVVALLAAGVMPLLVYASWFDAEHGTFGLTQYSGRMQYGKVMTFADCTRLPVTADLRLLCDARPVSARPGPDFYTWTYKSPVNQLWRLTGAQRDARAKQFTHVAIEHQPGDYAKAVLVDLAHYGAWTRATWRHAQRSDTWTFFDHPMPAFTASVASYAFQRGRAGSGPSQHIGLARALRGYQRYGYVPGTGVVLAGVASLVIVIRRRRRHPPKSDVALLLGSAVVVVLIPSMTVAFDYRFLLPELVVVPLALGLATTFRSGRPLPPNDAPAAPSEPAAASGTAGAVAQ